MAVNMVMRSGGDESAKRHLAAREAKLGHRRTLERSHRDQRQLDTQVRAMPRRWQTVDVGGCGEVDRQPHPRTPHICERYDAEAANLKPPFNRFGARSD